MHRTFDRSARSCLTGRFPGRPLGAADPPAAVDPDFTTCVHSIGPFGTFNEPERSRHCTAAGVGLVVVDLDMLDTRNAERCRREAAGHLDRVAPADVVDMDPVAKIQRATALSVVQAARTDDDIVAERAVVRVTTLVPVGTTGVDEIDAVGVAERFEARPGQPGSKVLNAGVDRIAQRSHVVWTPQAEQQSWRDDFARKTAHHTKMSRPLGSFGSRSWHTLNAHRIANRVPFQDAHVAALYRQLASAHVRSFRGAVEPLAPRYRAWIDAAVEEDQLITPGHGTDR